MRFAHYPLVVVLGMPLVWTLPAAGQRETVLHVFAGAGDGTVPLAGVVMDKSGNLFDTTSAGGAYGYGTVFELSPPSTGQTTWTESILHSFADFQNQDGAKPQAPLWFGRDGNLFGTTTGGGQIEGGGAIFELTPPANDTEAWNESLIYSFSLGAHGFVPLGSVLVSADGDFYGVTVDGGTHVDGTAYKVLAPEAGERSERTIFNFTGFDAGGLPYAGMVAGANGHLFGTTVSGGAFNNGVIYELSPPTLAGEEWTEAPIYAFTGKSDGGGPESKLLMGHDGSLYGTCFDGGDEPASAGVIFRLEPTGSGWTETVLYSFAGLNDGGRLTSALISDGNDGFYGTANTGGHYGFGTVFHLKPPNQGGSIWQLTTLHSFAGGDDGASPVGDLILEGGILYGATQGSGAVPGTVYAVVP
jgi:uncharacterized repeat protein (TIGR03803 family)